MMGSSRIGPAFLNASLKAKMPAILNASSLESTSWNVPSTTCDFDVNDLIAGIDAALDGFLDAVNDRRDVFLGNGAADDLVGDLDALALFIGLERDAGVAVLAAAAGLADELAFAFRRLGDGFAIGDLRRAGVGLHFEFALQAVA